ncbi:NifB/NifX family molybdenum-iron cluster-binding protein [bacterium]|nr:NifB/NifX family molybdenum-iron cluster-binding protein [bacterium]
MYKSNRILVPCFGEEVAPRFEVARRFRYWLIEGGEVSDYREIVLEDDGAFSRLRMLREKEINTLLCNGIEKTNLNLLDASGVEVVPHILGTASDAVFGYLAGRITDRTAKIDDQKSSDQFHTADLVEWTRHLFLGCNWRVLTTRLDNRYPIDLIAETQCPVCGLPVRVAITCGAHAYNVDEEIRELLQASSDGFHARVYVHQALPHLQKFCFQQKVELLAPSRFSISSEFNQGELPPLTGRINNHEKLNVIHTSSSEENRDEPSHS